MVKTHQKFNVFLSKKKHCDLIDLLGLVDCQWLLGLR